MILVFNVLTKVTLFRSMAMRRDTVRPALRIKRHFFMGETICGMSSPRQKSVVMCGADKDSSTTLRVNHIVNLPNRAMRVSGKTMLVGKRMCGRGGGFPRVDGTKLTSSKISLRDNRCFMLNSGEGGDRSDQCNSVKGVGGGCVIKGM